MPARGLLSLESIAVRLESLCNRHDNEAHASDAAIKACAAGLECGDGMALIANERQDLSAFAARVYDYAGVGSRLAVSAASARHRPRQ